ncbi:MAG: IPT/TIG domain-containing protein [Planctomycetes bacterium]|nr:IPT/TIG domain-containing protein [Planctomycetota bacterium]
MNRRHTSLTWGGVALAIVLLALARPAQAATISWIGATNTTWSVGTNWDSGLAPGAGDDVVIDGFQPNSSVVLDITPSTLNNLSLLNGATLTTGGNSLDFAGNVTLALGCDLTVSAGGSLSVSGTPGWGGGNGTLTAAAGSTLALTGGAAQTLPAGTYDMLQISNASGVLPGGDVSAGIMILAAGASFDTNNFALTLSGDIIDSGGSVIILRVPTASPSPPPNDNYAISANDISLSGTLTLSGAGRLALVNCTISPAGTLIAHQGTLAANDANLEVTGNWTNDGTYTAGTDGNVVFTGPGASTIGGSALSIFAHLQLSKSVPQTVTSTGSIEVTADFSIGALTTFSQAPGNLFSTSGGGPVTLSAPSGTHTFADFQANATTTNTSAAVTTWNITDSFNVIPGCTLNLCSGCTVVIQSAVTSATVGGSLSLGGGTLDFQSTAVPLDVSGAGALLDFGGVGSALDLAPSSVLLVGGGAELTHSAGSGILTLGNGASLSIQGTLSTAAGSPVFTSTLPGSDMFSAGLSGGSSILDLNGGTFDGLDSSGLVISDLTTVTALDNVSFQNAPAGGRFICISRNDNSATTLTWNNLTFDASFLPGGFNIEATNIGSALTTINVASFAGAGSGESFDSELTPLTVLVTWGAFTPMQPDIDEVIPDFSSTSGGAFITIEGNNFQSGDLVTIGGSPASSVTVVSSTEITCVAPSGSAGATSLVVQDPGSMTTSRPFYYADGVTYTNSISAGSAAVDYRMLSIPGFLAFEDVTPTLESSLGEYDVTQWRAFFYEPSFGGYVELDPDSVLGASDSAAGRAIWILSRAGGTASFFNGSTAPSIAVHVAIEPGWNQIGNPYSSAVAWTAVEVHDVDPNTGQFTGSPAPATSSPFIDNTLFLWNGSDYVSSATVEPGEGYWVFNSAGHDVSLEFQNPGGAFKPSVGPVLSTLGAPGLAPPPPPGVSFASGSTSSSSSSSSGSDGTLTSGGGGGSGSSSTGGGGGGGGGCWVDTASGSRGTVHRWLVSSLLILMVVLLGSRARVSALASGFRVPAL